MPISSFDPRALPVELASPCCFCTSARRCSSASFLFFECRRCLPWMDFAAPVRCCSSAAAAAAAMSGAGSGVLPFRCGFESERATAPSPRLKTSRRDTWPRALAWMWVAAAYAELKCPIRSRGVVLAVNAPTGGVHREESRLEGPESRIATTRQNLALAVRRKRSAAQAYPSRAG